MGMHKARTRKIARNYLERETLGELEHSTLIDWYVVIKRDAPCIGQKSTPGKKSDLHN